MEETWIDRLRDEATDLRGKLGKLDTFIASNAYGELPAADRDLLMDQRSFMYGYSCILAARLERANPAQRQAMTVEILDNDDAPAAGDGIS